MTSEMFRREKMQNQAAHSDYVGALFEDQRRLVLVGVDPDEPWEAFRRIRKVVRRERSAATIALYESPVPIEHEADVIELNSRRRAG